MKTTNELLFIFLHIVAWIIFVGLSIEAGGLLVNFGFSLFAPEMVAKLYQKLDLSVLYQQNSFAYFSMYSFVLSIALLKTFMFYWVILLVSKLKLENPFNPYVAGKISQISYYTLAIGLISLVARQSAENLTHYGYDINGLSHFWVDSQAYLLMAAVIYIIATIFSRGVELQRDNELTI